MCSLRHHSFLGRDTARSSTNPSGRPSCSTGLLGRKGKERKVKERKGRRRAIEGSRGHGEARAPPPPLRRGGVLPVGARRVHDRQPGAALGLHPQGVRDRLHPDARHRGRRCRHEPHRLRPDLLPLPHPRRPRRLHPHPHLPPPRDAADGVFPEEAPGEPGVPGHLHRVHQPVGGARVPHQARAHHLRGGRHDARGGGLAHRLHLLGGQARPRLRVPRPLPLRRLRHPLPLRPRHGALPPGQDRRARLRLHRRPHLLRLHHLRHRQPHQALHLRRVHRRLHHPLPRHHQPLQGHPHGPRGRRLISSSYQPAQSNITSHSFVSACRAACMYAKLDTLCR